MPEANYGVFWTAEPPKKAPIIKVSCGIGDTDGFPAFDVDSDAYANKDDSKWGFLITGGAEFHMPLTVFQVTPESLADRNGVRLGDIILEINEEDATHLTLAQAHEKIDASGKKIHFLLKNMEEDDPMGTYAAGEEKSIVMRVPKPLPEKAFNPTPLLGSRCWHPIMWHDPPEPPKPKKKKTKTEIDEEGNEVVIELSEDESSDEEEKELPHHRIMRNIRRFFAEVGDNTELKNSTIENMLLALPSASKSVGASNGRIAAASIEARLREMQRKLSAIAEIPKILSSTLATVSQTFDKLMPAEQQAVSGYAHRKCSYDEDAIDYELTTVEEVEELYECDDDDDNDDDDDYDCVDANDVSVGDVSLNEKLRYAQSKLKDVTPESDYASEANYPANEASEDEAQSESDYYDNDTACSSDVEADEADERDTKAATAVAEEDVDDVDNEAVFYLKLPKLVAITPAAAGFQLSNVIEDFDGYQQNDNDGIDDDDDADGDFLSTTYTWNLRNIPKLRLNDEYDEIDLTLNIEQRRKNTPDTNTNTDNDDDGDDDDDEEEVSVTSTKQQMPQAAHNNNNADVDVDAVAGGEDEDEADAEAKPTPTERAQKVLFKLDNMERAWPWADRERIIYKQSTCHLVPRKPLGLIEKRIQLLAKQHLLEKLQTADAK